MSGSMFCHGACISCWKPITFSVARVPSIRVNGSREPLCRACFRQWNKIHRIAKGLPPVPLDPMAYEPERCL